MGTEERRKRPVIRRQRERQPRLTRRVFTKFVMHAGGSEELAEQLMQRWAGRRIPTSDRGRQLERAEDRKRLADEYAADCRAGKNSFRRMAQQHGRPKSTLFDIMRH